MSGFGGITYGNLAAEGLVSPAMATKILPAEGIAIPGASGCVNSASAGLGSGTSGRGDLLLLGHGARGSS